MGSPRIALVGAGSAVFARALIRDTYTFPELRDAELRLMDIDPARLADTAAIAGRLARGIRRHRLDHVPTRSRLARSRAPTSSSPCSRSAATSPPQ